MHQLPARTGPGRRMDATPGTERCCSDPATITQRLYWHKHDAEDEFFFVLEGRFLIDLEGRTIELGPHQGFVVPKGVVHRTRAPQRAVILMVEGAGIVPTGDA